MGISNVRIYLLSLLPLLPMVDGKCRPVEVRRSPYQCLTIFTKNGQKNNQAPANLKTERMITL